MRFNYNKKYTGLFCIQLKRNFPKKKQEKNEQNAWDGTYDKFQFFLSQDIQFYFFGTHLLLKPKEVVP